MINQGLFSLQRIISLHYILHASINPCSKQIKKQNRDQNKAKYSIESLIPKIQKLLGMH